jgi:hypothetical protein
MFNTREIKPAVQNYPTREAKVRYKLEIYGCKYPLPYSMRPYMQRLLVADTMGGKTLELIIAAWAKSTSETHGNAIKQRLECYEERCLPPLAATTTTVARYIPWI